MSSLRGRLIKLERQTGPIEADPIRCIFLVAPFRETRPPSRGYQNGEITVRRQPGETDEALGQRVEQMSGPGIRLWAEVA